MIEVSVCSLCGMKVILKSDGICPNCLNVPRNIKVAMRRIIGSFIAFVAIPTSVFAAEIAYRFPKDEILRYTYRSSTSVSYKGDAARVTESADADCLYDFDGSEYETDQKVTITYKEYVYSSSSPEGKTFIDTRKPCNESALKGDIPASMFVTLPGESFTAGVATNGNINNIEGFALIVRRALARAVGSDNALSETLNAIVISAISDETMKQGLRIVFIAFPGDAKSGSEWKSKMTQRVLAASFEFNLNYKLTALTATSAVVSITGTTKLTIDNTSIPKEGEMTGSASFDIKNGRLLQTSVSANLKLPNISFKSGYELKFQKALSRKECGPESYEKPLKPGLKLIERRNVIAKDEKPVFAMASLKEREVSFFLLDMEPVRVVEKNEAERVLRIITKYGREGWIEESKTVLDERE